MLRMKKLPGTTPKTTALGCPFTASTINSTGVAAVISGLRLSFPARDSGSREVVGSDAPDWKRPRSEPPRWINPAADSLIPSESDSSATIIATPTPTPRAVRRVRARRRRRLLRMIAVTDRLQLQQLTRQRSAYRQSGRPDR